VFGLILVGVITGYVPALALTALLALPFFYKTWKLLNAGSDGTGFFPAMTQNVLGVRLVGVIVTVSYLIAAVFRV
jgi:1,4-dihydroxy-2-naphthoate octaprenyltransferase